MKKIIVWISCALIILLVGCNKEIHSTNESILDYNNDVDIATLKEHKLSKEIERLNCPNVAIMGKSAVDNINELKKNKVIDVIKYNKGKYYSVTKVEGKQYLFLLYDNENYNMIDGCLISKLADKSLFKDIKVGMSKTEIKNKDASMLEYSDYSYHHMNDKSLLEIKYKRKDGQDIISEFSYLDEPISVIDYLTKEDLEKIMK